MSQSEVVTNKPITEPGMDSLQTRLEFTLRYASLGWPVFPVHSIENGVCTCRKGRNCGSPGKHPRTKKGFKAVTTDKTKIHRWWKDHPESNIGIATGKVSGLVAGPAR
jgi:hypothetical protein